ncbi:hypothetical protein HOF67_02000 [Candidatus Peregrinibacteria bacterium]|jgi:hypothetical protein|nr:hypothetical protein [Candidatus Peregrinibacteria bacterium]
MNPVALMLSTILGPIILVLGLSILLHAGAWKKLAKMWLKDHYSLIGLKMLVLLLGVIVVNAHNVWELTPSLIVTIIGWAMLLKGVLYFLLPGSAIKWALKLVQKTWILYVGGAIDLLLGLAMCYYAYYPFLG